MSRTQTKAKDRHDKARAEQATREEERAYKEDRWREVDRDMTKGYKTTCAPVSRILAADLAYRHQ